MSEKKRKATATLDRRPKKKPLTNGDIAVEHVAGVNTYKPILATSAGPAFPETIRFQAFSKKSAHGTELLIHSSDHPTIDYVAAEGAEPGERYLKHYIATYDPAANRMNITEAKKVMIRASVRQQKTIDDDEDENSANFTASQSTRSALTEAFGSKKSKKAVQSIAENRQLGQGFEGVTIAEAIAANMVDNDDDDQLPIDPATTARNAKPLPTANIVTDDIEEVYSISKLIYPYPASNTLREMQIEPWKARLKAGTEISVRTRFVANRVGYIGKKAIEEESARFNQQLQLLRYIELLIELAQYCGTQDRRRKMDFVDKWPERTLSPGVSMTTVKHIVNHFFPDNVPSERAMTLLRTTTLAFTLHILPPSGRTGEGRLVAEPTDIQLDLAMSEAEVRKLYQELGCKVAPASDKDLIEWGYQRLVEKQKKNSAKDGALKVSKLTFAILRFPLNFPKMSMGRKKR